MTGTQTTTRRIQHSRTLAFRLLTFLILGLLTAYRPAASLAQSLPEVWIQVESKKDILDARDRAQFFARSFPDTHAFVTTTGWYAIAIGPLPRDVARRQLARLRADGRIPRDSFVSDGRTYLSQFWPLSANNTPRDDQAMPPVPPQEAGPVTAPTAGSSAAGAAADSTAEAPATRPEPEPAATATTAETTAPPAKTAQQTAQPAAPAAAGPIRDPNPAATRRFERSLPRERKKAIQTWLTWTGDYDSTIDGAFGRGTRRAIRAFQKREGFQATGYLTRDQLALLEKRYGEITARLGVREMRNLDAGIAMPFPSKLVTFDRFEPPFVHYRPLNDSGVRMMLISQKGDSTTLRGLYDLMETLDTVPPEGYRKIRRRWFVLTGRNDRIVSYSYARLSKGMIKGFSLVWPVALDAQIQPLVSAMYDGFTPLDDHVLDENLGRDKTTEKAVSAGSDLDVKQPDRAATAFVVNADGVLLTNVANVDGCARLTINDGIEVGMLFENRSDELAILKPIDPFRPASYALFSDLAPKLGDKVTISGFSFPDVMDAAVLNYGTITDLRGAGGEQDRLRVSAFLERGDVGGPVLDGRGAVVGLSLQKPGIDSNLPEYVNFALDAGTITATLSDQEITFGIARSRQAADPVDLAAMAADFTVKLSCWKQ